MLVKVATDGIISLANGLLPGGPFTNMGYP